MLIDFIFQSIGSLLTVLKLWVNMFSRPGHSRNSLCFQGLGDVVATLAALAGVVGK